MINNIIILTCCSFLFFFKSFKYGYVSDDIPVYHEHKGKYKGIKALWFQITGLIRTTPRKDHILTTLIHTATSIFVYTAFGCTDISFLAALLFCFNATNNQGSVWISGRGYVLPTLLILAYFTFPLIFPLFLYIAPYFNAGFFGIAVIAFSDQWIFSPFVLLAWALHYRNFKKNVNEKMSREMFDEDKKIHPKKLILFFKTLGYYISLCVFPFRTTFYHAMLQSAAGNDMMKKKAYFIDRYFAVGLSTFLLFSYYILTHNNMISFAMAWTIITIAPFCNMFRLSQEIAERYVYMPSVGILYIIASILAPYPVLFIALLMIHATKLWFYMDAYQDDYFLTETACINSRDAWFSWHVRAMKRWDHKAYKEAVILWVMAKMISPTEFKVLFNLASALCLMNNKKEADEHMKIAMDNVPKGQEKQAQKLFDDYNKGNLAVLL